jgi:hypothetical protein
MDQQQVRAVLGGGFELQRSLVRLLHNWVLVLFTIVRIAGAGIGQGTGAGQAMHHLLKVRA